MSVPKNERTWRALLLFFSFALLTLAACVSPATQLQGSYEVNIPEEEIPTGFGFTNLTPDDIALLSGNWQIDFLPDGIFTVSKDGEIMIEEGHYAVDNDLVTVGEETGPASCVGPPARVEEQATYRWVRQESRLLLLPVDEKCGGRLVVFSALPWTWMK